MELIVHRFGKRYELPLLVQSIIMNIMMLAMIQLCVRVRNKTNLVPYRGQDKFFTGNWPYFTKLIGAAGELLEHVVHEDRPEIIIQGTYT